MDGVSVYHSRIQAGQIPGHGFTRWMQTWWWVYRSPAMRRRLAIPWQSGIPYGTAFVKNSYVGQNLHQAEAEQPGIQRTV